MWNLPGTGVEPVSPALAGGFLTTAPPGKSQVGETVTPTHPGIVHMQLLHCAPAGMESLNCPGQTLQEGKGRKETLTPKESPPLSLSLLMKFQEMAALIAPLLAVQVHPLDAPTQTGLTAFPIPDPKKPATHASPSLAGLTSLSLL